MTADALRHLVLIVLTLAAVSTVSFPLLYLRFPWRSTVIGRALMAKSSSTALMVNTILLLVFWQPSMQIRYSILIVVFSGIAVSTLRLTFVMYRVNTALEQRKEASR